jgi:hypothetical protein
MTGMRREWVKGPRTFVEGASAKGKVVQRLGKNGGPVVEQHVELWLVPKGSS